MVDFGNGLINTTAQLLQALRLSLHTAACSTLSMNIASHVSEQMQAFFKLGFVLVIMLCDCGCSGFIRRQQSYIFEFSAPNQKSRPSGC